MASKPWRDVNAIYQIYPRSFMDSNNDGVGDIRGVIDCLEYLHGKKHSLGVDAIWFSPICPSPMADMGYDVSNYCDIDPLFGTLDDFRELIEKAHAMDVNVMMDFVPNHTSNQHPWFLESRKNKTGDKKDYYVWRDAKPDGSVPNNWQSIFGGSVWEWDDERKQYYLHTFLKEQPDLNWDNPLVRDEMKQVIRFWMDMGVDGIRADAVRWISKDPALRDDPVNPEWHDKGTLNHFDALLHKNSRFGKKLFTYLRELTDVMAEYDNRIMIFEDYPDGLYTPEEQYLGFYGINPEIGIPFNFQGLSSEYNAAYYRDFITDFQGMLNPDIHRPVYCVSNHDNPRVASRLGGEDQARLIALMLFTLPGLPTMYYGDEIGLPDTDVPLEKLQDLSVISSGDVSVGRDPERTPMQWTNVQYGGFSATEPWLPVGKTIAKHNVLAQMHEPDSVLSLYRRLLKLRSRHEILRSGSYELLDEGKAHQVFMYARWLNDQHVYVALNFGKKSQRVKLPHGGRVLCCTHPVDYPDVDSEGYVTLRPNEGVLVECVEHPLLKI